MSFAAAISQPLLAVDFHAAQQVRATTRFHAIERMAEENPDGLAALLRANPRMLNHMPDAEAIAKALAEAGYVELCDNIALDREVTRDVRSAFKYRGAVDQW